MAMLIGFKTFDLVTYCDRQPDTGQRLNLWIHAVAAFYVAAPAPQHLAYQER